MKKINMLITILVLCLPLVTCTGAEEKADTGPTAIVIDNATGQPVEGAIALAQWFSAGGGGLFEGGVDNLEKAAEAYSDKEGKIYIKDYWGKQKYSRRLTIYKPGYVLWDSRRICPTLEGRTDFDEKRRIVKLLKFDTEAGKWVKDYPNRSGGRPYEMQDSCFSYFYNDDAQKFSTKLWNIYRGYSLPLLHKERNDLMRKQTK